MLTPQKIIDAIEASGGCSLDYMGESPPDTGYMVSVFGYEMRLVGKQVDYGILSAYLEWVRPQLRRKGYYFGAWFDGDHLYLDVSIWVEDLDAALSLGEKAKQEAIYAIALRESIPVKCVLAGSV